MQRSGREPARWLWPLAVCLLAAVNVALPLLHSRSFYLRGDSATQFGPTWYHLGALVREGTWPVWIDADSWAGGNFVGEALFGVYNPLNAVVWVAVSASSNVLVAVTAVKLAVMVLLALGTYLVCREYGAARWASAVMATALPVAGFTMFWESPSWAAGLFSFAYAPWVWWSFRRATTGALNPFLAFLVGVLAVTNGNPYGTLGVVVVGLAVLLEAAVQRRWRGMLRLLAVGVCVAAFLPLVYLPLLDAVGLSYRVDQVLIGNQGNLRPDAGALFGVSSPTFVPDIPAFSRAIRIPATYFCWFLVPLLPWLRFDVLRRRAHGLTGVAVVVAVYLVGTIGPSKLWMFRWPLRLVEYLELGLAVGLAVLLTEGLHRDRWRARLVVTAGLVAFVCWLTWAETPEWRRAAFVGPAVLVALTCVLLAWHRWGPRGAGLLAVPLLVGTPCVVLAQGLVFPVNSNLHGWPFTYDVAALHQRVADRQGPLIQFADPNMGRQGRAQRKNFLGGSQYAIAGVESVNRYSGMGYKEFTRTLCLRFNGYTWPCGGFGRLWQPLASGEPPLADLMKLRTVVAEPDQARAPMPSGWSVERQPGVVTVRRTGPLPYPGSELSWVTPAVRVRAAETLGPYHERVALATTGPGGEAAFAMLAWPGYRATFAGEPVAVRPNEAGLLTVRLPADSAGTLDVSYRPPRFTTGVLAAGTGLLGALALGLVSWRRRRQSG